MVDHGRVDERSLKEILLCRLRGSITLGGLPSSTIGTFIEQYKAGVKRPAIISAAKARLRENRHLHE
jgi:hypothetical protein